MLLETLEAAAHAGHRWGYALRQQDEDERMRMHPLIQALACGVFAEWREKERERAERAVVVYYVEYVSSTPSLELALEEANLLGEIEWAQTHGEDLMLAHLCTGVCGFWRDTGRTHTTLRCLPLGIAVVKRIASATNAREPRLWQLELAEVYGDTLVTVGRLEEANILFRQDLLVTQELHDRQREANTLGRLGGVARALVRPNEAHRYFKESLVICREVGDLDGKRAALNNLGLVAKNRGQFAEARSYLEQSLGMPAPHPQCRR